jgi:hypothetical protein
VKISGSPGGAFRIEPVLPVARFGINDFETSTYATRPVVLKHTISQDVFLLRFPIEMLFLRAC